MAGYNRHSFESTPLTSFFYVLCKKKQGWYFEDDTSSARKSVDHSENDAHRQSAQESDTFQKHLERSPSTQRRDTKKSKVNATGALRRIPDTVVWENNIPKGWFTFDENEQHIVRRKMETKPVFEAMTRGWHHDQDVVAILIGRSMIDDSHFFEFLTRRALYTLLFESKCAKGTIVLQKFMRPFNSDHVDTIQVIWSPHVTQVTRRENVHPFQDISIPPLRRCATYEGPTFLSQEVHISQSLKHDIRLLCQDFVHHFQDTENKYRISRLVLHMMLTDQSGLYLTYVPSVRVVSASPKQSAIRRALELRTTFDVSGRTVRQLMRPQPCVREAKHEKVTKLDEAPGNVACSSTHNSKVLKESNSARRERLSNTQHHVPRNEMYDRHAPRPRSSSCRHELTSTEIWAVQESSIFPPMEHGQLTNRSNGPDCVSHLFPSAMPYSSRSGSLHTKEPGTGGSMEGIGDFLSPVLRDITCHGRFQLAQVLRAYELHSKKYPLKSSHLKMLRSLNPRIEELMNNDAYRSRVRCQYLALKEMNDAEKIEFLHLRLATDSHPSLNTTSNELHVDSTSAHENSARTSHVAIDSMGCKLTPHSDVAAASLTAPVDDSEHRKNSSSESQLSAQDARSIALACSDSLREFEYAAHSHFLGCAHGQRVPMVYIFPPDTSRLIVQLLAEQIPGMYILPKQTKFLDTDQAMQTQRRSETTPHPAQPTLHCTKERNIQDTTTPSEDPLHTSNQLEVCMRSRTELLDTTSRVPRCAASTCEEQTVPDCVGYTVWGCTEQQDGCTMAALHWSNHLSHHISRSIRRWLCNPSNVNV